MEYVVGSNYLRRLKLKYMAGEVILGHQHNFPHMTFIHTGSWEVTRLKNVVVDAAGMPVQAEVDSVAIVSATDECPWVLIEAGVWHQLKAREDNSSYFCIYSHQAPQALSAHVAGQLKKPEWVKVDEHGDTWLRVDPTIVQVHNGWEAAYR